MGALTKTEGDFLDNCALSDDKTTRDLAALVRRLDAENSMLRSELGGMQSTYCLRVCLNGDADMQDVDEDHTERCRTVKSILGRAPTAPREMRREQIFEQWGGNEPLPSNILASEEPTESAGAKCGHCIHPPHGGMCTGRNGGTAYPCPCFHSSGTTPTSEESE